MFGASGNLNLNVTQKSHGLKSNKTDHCVYLNVFYFSLKMRIKIVSVIIKNGTMNMIFVTIFL